VLISLMHDMGFHTKKEDLVQESLVDSRSLTETP
jgi:hypothetical protein